MKAVRRAKTEKALQSRLNVKVFLTVLFDGNGMVHHEFLPQGHKVNREYYLEVMRRLSEAICQKRIELWKNHSWILHHKNAPVHTAMLVSFWPKQNRDHASTTVFIGLGPR